MLSFPMPFKAVPCCIWLPKKSEEDDWGNTEIAYEEDADIVTVCCYSPGSTKPDTDNDIEIGRPHGASVDMTFFLPKTVIGDLREALIACYPSDDPYLSGQKFKVVGMPFSYSRANTPGDYSWMVEGVMWLG